MQKYNKYKKLNEKDQKTNKFFHKLHRYSLQDNLIDKNEYECLCIVYIEYVDETRTESFLRK